MTNTPKSPDALRIEQERSRQFQELTERYPHVSNLFGATFNQDWMCDHETWDAAVEDWLGDYRPYPQKRLALRLELEGLLADFSEDDLRSAFDMLHTGYIPADDGMSHAEFLREVLRRLRAAA